MDPRRIPITNDERVAMRAADLHRRVSKIEKVGSVGDNVKPGNHASTHSMGAADEITPQAIGAVRRVGLVINADGIETTWTLDHNIGTRAVIVQAFDQDTGEQMDPTVTRNNSNQITLTFGTAPALDQGISVIVLG